MVYKNKLLKLGERNMIKKILKIIVPSLLILSFILIDRRIESSKNILVGLYLIFPMIFIIQGGLYKDFKKELVAGFMLSSMAVLSMDFLYKMNSILPVLVIYIALGLISFFIMKIKKWKDEARGEVRGRISEVRRERGIEV